MKATKTDMGRTVEGKHPGAKLVVPKGADKQGVHTAQVAGADAKSKTLASVMYPSMKTGAT